MDLLILQSLMQPLEEHQKTLFIKTYEDNKKSLVVAYIWLVLFGGFGGHKFYMNNNKGWLYLIFCWTGIPSIFAIIDLFLLPKQVSKYNQDKAIEIITFINSIKELSQDSMATELLIKGKFAKTSPIKLVLVVIVALIIMAIVRGIAKSGLTSMGQSISSPSTSLTTNVNQQSTGVPDMTVDAISLYNEYKTNEVVADNKYKGHLLAITGQIADIHKIDENTVDVEVGTDEFGMGDVICEMSTQNSALNSLSKGQNITLIGEVNGEGLTLERVKLKEGCYIATGNNPATSVASVAPTEASSPITGGNPTDPIEQLNLGKKYYAAWLSDTSNNQTDVKQALYWYQKAAEQGNAEAEYELAGMYRFGWGGAVNQDMKQSLYWYQKSAEQGNVNAQFELAQIYDDGIGGATIDKKQALYWYQKAAEQNDTRTIQAANNAIKRLSTGN